MESISTKIQNQPGRLTFTLLLNVVAEVLYKVITLYKVMRNKNQDDTNFKGGNQVVYRWHDCLHGGKKKNSAKNYCKSHQSLIKLQNVKWKNVPFCIKKRCSGWERTVTVSSINIIKHYLVINFTRKANTLCKEKYKTLKKWNIPKSEKSFMLMD